MHVNILSCSFHASSVLVHVYWTVPQMLCFVQCFRFSRSILCPLTCMYFVSTSQVSLCIPDVVHDELAGGLLPCLSRVERLTAKQKRRQDVQSFILFLTLLCTYLCSFVCDDLKVKYVRGRNATQEEAHSSTLNVSRENCLQIYTVDQLRSCPYLATVSCIVSFFCCFTCIKIKM